MPLGSIVGGFIGAGGASAAGSAAGAAGDKALQAGQDWAKTLHAWASPWTDTGIQAEDQLLQLYGLGHLYPTGDQYGDSGVDSTNWQQDQKNALAKFQLSPGYNFRLQQGVNALDRSASARGMNLSGAQGQALTDYGQGQASQEWGNYLSGLNALATGGSNALAQSSASGTGPVTAGLNGFTQGNLARASSYSNAANALASGIGNGINNAFSLASFGLGGGFGGGAGDGSTMTTYKSY